VHTITMWLIGMMQGMIVFLKWCFYFASLSRYLWQSGSGDVHYDGMECSINRLIPLRRFMSMRSAQWAVFCTWWERERLSLIYGADFGFGYTETAVAIWICFRDQDLQSRNWWGRISVWHHCGASVGRRQHGCHT
jgi:hypothetical protein